MGVFGVLFHRGGELFHAGGGFFHRGGLLLGTGGQIGIACGNLRSGGGHLADAHLDFLNHVAQVLAHRRHGIQQLPQFIATGAGLRLPQIATGNAFRQRQRTLQRSGDLQRDAPGDQQPGNDGNQRGDAHLQLRGVDIVMGLRQFVLHKGVDQRTDFLRAVAQLLADVLLLLISRQVGLDTVLVIIKRGQQRLQQRTLSVVEPPAERVGRATGIIYRRDQRGFGLAAQAQQQAARAVAHQGQFLVQLNEGQLQVAIGKLTLYLIQAVLHFRHVPALAHGILCRYRLLESVLLLLVAADQLHQTLQVFAALGIPV